MLNMDVIRAWKDEAYRLSLGETERAVLPPNRPRRSSCPRPPWRKW
jgi:hypothetical protein